MITPKEKGVIETPHSEFNRAPVVVCECGKVEYGLTSDSDEQFRIDLEQNGWKKEDGQWRCPKCALAG